MQAPPHQAFPYRQPAPVAVDPEAPFAAVTALGPMASEHRATGASRWVGVVLGGLSLLGAGASVLIGGLSLLEELSRRRPDPLDALIGPLVGLALCVPLAGLFFWIAWRNWRRAAALFQDGFAYYDQKGLRLIRWEEIEAVYQHIVKQYVNGVYTGTYHTYKVFLRDGAKIVLDNRLRDVEPLGGGVVRASARALQPRYANALDAGQRLFFGPLALDLQGLYAGKKALSWGEIKAIKLEQGVLSVAKEGKWLSWASVTVPQVPNFYVLMTLLSRFTTVE
jgi:hypothetical protein